MVWEDSLMSIQVSFDMSKINIEEFEVRWKVSKNSKWLVISNCQKWKGLLLKITCPRKLQMKFCPTWKLISCSHLSKKSKNIHFSCVVEELWSNHCQGNLNFKLAQLLNQMAKSCGSFWNISLLIFSIQFMHHISSNLITKILHFSLELNLNFGGKRWIWKLCILFISNQLPLPPNRFLSLLQVKFALFHWPCVHEGIFAIFFISMLISLIHLAFG